jgi:hypothetical protein
MDYHRFLIRPHFAARAAALASAHPSIVRVPPSHKRMSAQSLQPPAP